MLKVVSRAKRQAMDSGYLGSAANLNADLGGDGERVDPHEVERYGYNLMRTTHISFGLSLDPPMNWLVTGCRNEESAF